MLTDFQKQSIKDLAKALYLQKCHNLLQHSCAQEFNRVAAVFGYNKSAYHCECKEVSSLLRKTLSGLYTIRTNSTIVWQNNAPILNDFVPRITRAIRNRLK